MESDGKLLSNEDSGNIRVWDQRRLSRVQANEEKRFQENMEHLNKEKREVARCFEKDKQEWVKRYADHCAAMNMNTLPFPGGGSMETYSSRGRDLIRRNTLHSVSNPVSSARLMPASGSANCTNTTATSSEDVTKSFSSTDVLPQSSASRKISINSPLSSPSRGSVLNYSQSEENEPAQLVSITGALAEDGNSSPKNCLPTWKQQETPIIRRLTPHKIKKEKRECAEIAAMFCGCPVKLDTKSDACETPQVAVQSQPSGVITSTSSRIRRQQSTPNYMSSTKTSLLRYKHVS